ncbi:mannose-1-phosphate guanylyltransferase/mannose-6-phosphate isomerase [Roseibacterium sp. SDUM158017]|uniref:mannose-1-phosphate guanylyltransferase/mannose-6-phosphate isomerase n=1 Tax=Roseicyclus salinarum TaxID=3036773 RepID=UPI00241516AB|nr:mannose-1-phosphate guanylyltransferase/mannose-6-phosphate isomerase [Roseibacterium sp. SDUM158017]MDG4649645.1 mannose-1-phosphate guanylyltransferase/mannose-6-phosphate isomerase [Roseibacterium sp. SDUM158017]
MIHPVILCGGSGTRLWPVSRKTFPKQFAPLLGQQSLYQMTLRRLAGETMAAPLVITAEEFRFIATEQARAAGVSDARVIVEPLGRDTAAAVLTAALMLDGQKDALMLIAPSDHLIEDADAFRAAVEAGVPAAREGAFVTFGVTPERAETGYGYLELAQPASGTGPVPLRSFREKPDAATAEAFVASGGYLWNAGIFLVRVASVLEAYKAHAPQMIDLCRAARAGGVQDLDFFRLAPEPYAAVEPISFDYAIMEKVDPVMVVPLSCGWTDLGAWDALWANSARDGDGNAAVGPVTAIDCSGTYLRSEDPDIQLVGLGLRGVVAVATKDAVLVADRARAQDVKRVVDMLRKAGQAQADEYPRFHRPWGWYETLCLGSRFQVKRIMVKPGGILSLQSHMHRSEHWVVVSGTAEVTIGQETRLVTENQSVYIPLGVRHRMANKGHVPMYLIEVQTGAYLGEDDIVRYEDAYNRS